MTTNAGTGPLQGGRINRLRFVTYHFLGAVLVALIATLVGPLLPWAKPAASLAYALLTLHWMVRRLHDTDHSGFWVLLGGLPPAGAVMWLWLFFAPGSRGYNRFGPAPIS